MRLTGNAFQKGNPHVKNTISVNAFINICFCKSQNIFQSDFMSHFTYQILIIVSSFTGEYFKFYCSLDVTTYPWDRQKCSLKFMVWGYYSDEVQLMTPTEDIDIRYYFGSGAWELESTKATMEGTIIPTVLFTINIRRFPEFAVVNVLVPVLTLTVLNLFAFLIPPESGEKLSYCITVFLAFAVFLTIIADHLPGNSNNMALLCYFLMFVLLLSTFICVSAVIRHFSLLNVNAAGACGYDFPCDGGRLVRAYLRRRRGTI